MNFRKMTLGAAVLSISMTGAIMTANDENSTSSDPEEADPDFSGRKESYPGSIHGNDAYNTNSPILQKLENQTDPKN